MILFHDNETKIRWHKSLCSCSAKDHTRYCEMVRGTDVEKYQLRGTPNTLIYCEIFLTYKQFENVSMAHSRPAVCRLETQVLKSIKLADTKA